MKVGFIKIEQKEWISFILTLIATLIGVLIAIWLTNIGISKKERQDTIKLLHSAQLIVYNTNQYSGNLHHTILEISKDTTQNDEERIASIKLSNPIPYPDLLETIITNELISKNTSRYAHSYLYNSLINFRKLAKYETIDYYQKSLNELKLLLDLEIEYQEGKISSKELETKFKNQMNHIMSKYPDENILEIDTK